MKKEASWFFATSESMRRPGSKWEALAGVHGALLCIYDLSKAVNPVLKISEIRLNFKLGGKTGEWFHPEYKEQKKPPAGAQDKTSKQHLEGMKFAVLTVSDRAANQTRKDESGPEICQIVKASGAAVVATRIVSDTKSLIAEAFVSMCHETDADIIISTGGTGLSNRDLTPEALISISEREVPGLGELLRLSGSKHIRTAWLSRSVAGMRAGKLLISLPGSIKAVREGLDVLIPLLPHAVHTIKGGDHAV